MSTALETRIKDHIQTHGPMPVAEFMTRCLYDAQYGYYTRGINFTEAPARDFVTAPEISPLFGATLANWVAKTWAKLGSPVPFSLAEAGPGRGTLMATLLAQLQTAHPACFAAARPVLVETSQTLRDIQKQTLRDFPSCRWQGYLGGEVPIILIANELLDAFPVQPYVHTQTGWNLRAIDLSSQNALTLCDMDLKAELPALPAGWHPTEGAVWEASRAQALWLDDLKTRLMAHGGAALLIDYGAAALPPEGADTLQAVRQHKPVSILETPGETDLTAHVNFGAVASALGGLCTLEDLGPFLLAHGLVDLGLAHPTEQAALQRLIHPAQMGTLFKVLCCTYKRP